ncbi:hypothetical protein [Aeromicrobium sp.]|uniref:hypothetical protein n=1 Tax=Aeromicrobium sp. TaxID=1871063 RepID=UPI003C60014B
MTATPTKDAAHAGARVTWVTVAVSVLFTVLPLVVFLPGDRMTREIVLAVAAALVAAYVASVHPFAIFGAFAAVLGFIPYLHVPSTSVPLLLVLSVGVWVALAFLPGVRFHPGAPELWLLALVATALLSAVATGMSGTTIKELAAWVAATAIVVPVRFLPAAARATTVRVFVLSAAAASVLGIVLVRIDPFGVLLERLTIAGYREGRTNVQRVPGTADIATRLTGTFVEPNIAGLVLGAGLLLAVAYFRGPIRVALVVVIGAGLLLTLSRAAIATAAVAGVLLVLRTPGRQRITLVASGLVAGLGALAIPSVQARLLDSFGPSDTGTRARDLAFQEFPRAMQGHWVWGLGWDRDEFRMASLGRVINYVANGPLVTIYRGGVVLGILVVVVLLVLVVRSWFAARRSFEDAVVCCGVIGIVLVALQLDFPIVIQAPATALFSFLVGLSLAPHPPDPPGASRA